MLECIRNHTDKFKEDHRMQYGYFDEKAREYVITNPNTPAPWANYLGSPD